jgi:hypothetical protein
MGGFEIAQMMERLRAGDVRALARAVSVVEDGGVVAGELIAACRETAGRALRVGVTGPPGAGKSTLVDQMARWLRSEGESVGVVAVDPSSPYTGGRCWETGSGCRGLPETMECLSGAWLRGVRWVEWRGRPRRFAR